MLASGSPYRKALLERLGLPFTAAAPAIDESPRPDEAPADTAVRLAEAKARGVASAHPDALIVGSDQVADFQGTAIGKPRDPEDALEQLRAMQGRTIVFHTGLALLDARSGRCRRALVESPARFDSLATLRSRPISSATDPYDCAGSVKVEALGIALVHPRRK